MPIVSRSELPYLLASFLLAYMRSMMIPAIVAPIVGEVRGKPSSRHSS